MVRKQWHGHLRQHADHHDLGERGSCTSVYAADLDGDGDLDVLSASSSDDRIAWYENDGAGSFGGMQTITTSANGANSVHAADLDGDGDFGVLSASWNDDRIAWYENKGRARSGACRPSTSANEYEACTRRTWTVTATSAFSRPPNTTIVLRGTRTMVREFSAACRPSRSRRTETASVYAADLNGVRPQLAISGGADAALFVLSPITNQLRFKQPPDFEQPLDANGDNVYELEVKVTDSAGATGVQTLSITVGA